MTEYDILLTWDEEAGVWVAVCDEMPLTLEAGSLDLLMEQVRVAAPEVLEMNGKEYENVFLNFTTKRRSKVLVYGRV